MERLNAGVKEIEEKYGSEAAADVQRIVASIIKEDLLPKLIELQRVIGEDLGRFRADEMLPATDLQKTSFRVLRDRLKDHQRMMLLYKSVPAAVLFNLDAFSEIEEEISSTIAALHWEITEGRDVSPEEFWAALDDASPKAKA